MRSPLIRIAYLTALALAALPAPLASQAEPERPALPRGADRNDWEAYFDEGTRQFQRFPARAAAAFYWSARLDPTRAEPLFARWAAFYVQDWGLWQAYADEDPRIMERPDVMEHQSLRLHAYNRNPFVHRGFEAALWSRMGRQLRWDGATMAFMHYGRADFREAIDRFGRVVRANPERNARFRLWRALAFVGGSQLDSAGVELTELLATLRAQEQARVNEQYESKALLEYALGMLHDARGRPDEARRAWERALEEDLSMYPARAALARMALRERNAAEAVEHMTQVVEIAPGDAVMQFELGNALAAAGRHADAVAAYQLAIRLEPHWADPYLRMGLALERIGQPSKAAASYRNYLERAPRRQSAEIQGVTLRLAELGT
jgi:tetratricopeptide (TPR) repeat protein